MRVWIFFYLLFTLIITSLCYPQIDTTRKDFFPLKIGNLWQYRNESNNLGLQKVIGDTTIDGIKYFLLIHSLQSGGGVLRIDSLLRVINRLGGPYWGDSCRGNTSYESSIYHLNVNDSTIWKICDGLYLEQFVRFNGIRTMNIYGQPRDVMEFDYGGTADGDTIWFYGARLAKGIGLIEERHYEWSYWILQGAIIDGVQFGTIVSVNEMLEIVPEKIVLSQNYPNPFNPSTIINYVLKDESLVKIKVFDILGSKVVELVNETKDAGEHSIEFKAGSLPSGVYFYTLLVNGYTDSKKMLLLK